MLEGAELINLVFSLIILSVFWALSQPQGIKQFYYFNIALILLLLSGISTVLEGFVLYNFFNLLEHLFYLLSLILLTLAVVKTGKSYL
ncbi:MAG: hypothetical protein JXB00_02205 [Bacteroidales bacterium]|nr:hypothetical protein [Bacteroidales bacterium]